MLKWRNIDKEQFLCQRKARGRGKPTQRDSTKSGASQLRIEIKTSTLNRFPRIINEIRRGIRLQKRDDSKSSRVGLAAARQDGGNWLLEKGDSSRRGCEQGQEAKTIDAPIIWGIGPTSQRDFWGGRRTQMNGERRTGGSWRWEDNQ